MIITDQKSSDDAVDVVRVERHRVRVAGVEDGRERVDRTGSDVAEHDAKRADHNGQANSFSGADRAKRHHGF